MPATEVSRVDEREPANYELAFHVLPTVAEGEVAVIFQNLKDTITKIGGIVTVDESPLRVDLAYEIVKYLEGRNRKFTSAYFGWIRFTVSPAKIEEINEELEGAKDLLRHILIRLTKTEEAHPFFINDIIESLKQVQNIELDEVIEEEVESEEVVDEVDEEVVEDTKDGEEAADKV
ncbi:MAG: hypothetical protein RLZZ230_411 [Candidatus Parcubacteria bacterium]